MNAPEQYKAVPLEREAPEFDIGSGNVVERLIFNHRRLILLLCAIVTLVLGVQALKTQINASFEQMLPQSQSYIRNYLANRLSLASLGNSIRIDVENVNGDIYDPAYLRVLQRVHDATYLMPGVDRPFMKSLWAPGVRWTEFTEQGFKGGPVMPDDFDGSAAMRQRLHQNVLRAGLVGSLVSNDERSSSVFVPLLDKDPQTRQPLDYAQIARYLDEKIRANQSATVRIHVVGFAQVVGDLINGMTQVMMYFGVAALMVGVVIFWYTRCLRSTVLVIVCSMIAVVWQLGLVRTLGFAIDPYSVLVPFLVFAIGVSHGAQKMNGIMRDIGEGTDKYVAARHTFRRLFLAGFTALVADAVSFAVLVVIDIPVIRHLALTASLGVAVLVFTNLVLFPVLLSYTGVSPRAVRRAMRASAAEGTRDGLARLAYFTRRPYAALALVIALGLGAGAWLVSLNLKIGDLDAGAPEFRADSTYNRDSAYFAKHYGLSGDQFVVIVKTPAGLGGTYASLIEQDRLAQTLRGLPFVQKVSSASEMVRFGTAGNFEGSPKWLTINRDQSVLTQAVNAVSDSNPELINKDWTVTPVIAYLTDHKAETLAQVVDAVERFAAAHDSSQIQFLLAAGSAGIEAATNITVEKANRQMLLLVYASVIALCFITFRNWRAVIVAIIPLALTSIMCEALMVMLGIGVKVATLPVIALGVGIGVDYALYLLSVQLSWQRAGLPLEEAYARAIGFTGRVVALVGVTLAAGVVTWAWSPIKFQADMGILLTFMFLWNMLGALILIPALSHFLLRAVPARQAVNLAHV
ncbi:efflux RND transporter permease subunit [Paraburkholderia bannensis]|uniref:efflux RND transporter permease subunit n=1 Tax=Paraburkholderia bannensis TaxID=765414 RepID=UPI002AC33BA5|nr:MMPL family transporter [Paraburkholderia bannensis]